jgi:hypothetical protein
LRVTLLCYSFALSFNIPITSNRTSPLALVIKGDFNLKLFILLLIISAIATLRASEQDYGGSVVVLVGSKDKIVLAADGKETLTDTANGRETGMKCKLAILEGQVVFAPVNRVGHMSSNPKFSWDSYSLAHDSAHETNLASATGVKDVSTIWANKAVAMHNRDSQRGVITSDYTGHDKIESAFFVGTEHGNLVAYGVAIKKALANNPQAYTFEMTPVPIADGQIFWLGAGDIVTEFGAGQSDRAKGWKTEFNFFDWSNILERLSERLVDLTIEHSAEKHLVGRPIAVIEITTDGIHWIKKGSCP